MKKGKIWMIVALLFIGYSGGIITGVVVDADQVYHTTIKKIRQNKSPDGSIVIDVEAGVGEGKTKKELRQEKRDDRSEDRQIRKASRKKKKEPLTLNIHQIFEHEKSIICIYDFDLGHRNGGCSG